MSKTWNLLRHLLDETRTKSHHHNTLNRILHIAVVEMGESEVERRLDEKYVPTTPTDTLETSTRT